MTTAASFLSLLAHVVRRTGWNCHAFCLMPNHHHLIVTTHVDLLSVGLHQLNGRYAQAFNERHARSGHLLGNACEYVVQNPVRARLCARADDWRWSGSR